MKCVNLSRVGLFGRGGLFVRRPAPFNLPPFNPAENALIAARQFGPQRDTLPNEGWHGFRLPLSARSFLASRLSASRANAARATGLRQNK